MEHNIENQGKKAENKYLEEDLWHDLIKLMSINVAYTIKRLLPADEKNLYTHKPLEAINGHQINPFAKDFVPTPNTEKGGINISDNIIYNW